MRLDAVWAAIREHKIQDIYYVTKLFDGLVLMVICDLLDLKNNGALKKKE